MAGRADSPFPLLTLAADAAGPCSFWTCLVNTSVSSCFVMVSHESCTPMMSESETAKSVGRMRSSSG